jgi:GNAT superfamily N-acetyltransferase
MLDNQRCLGNSPTGNDEQPQGHYPKEWERHLTLQDHRAVFVRPIRPEDELLYGRFFAVETADDLRRRFFATVKDFNHKFIARFTRVDYAKAMAFIALDQATGEMLGVARLHATTDGHCGEFAILVRSDLKSHGLGWQLMKMIIAYARTKEYRCIEGQVLHENMAMVDMCKELGFHIRTDPDEPYICDMRLSL